jgi:hypothetical protein
MNSNSRPGHFGGEGNLLSFSGVDPEFLGCPARVLVTIQAELI